jgi:hypothetical protein
MTVYTVPNLKYTKGVRWLVEMYEQKQIDRLTAQTLNKLVDLETSRVRMQLEEIERVMADYERQYGMNTADFFRQFEADQLGDRMDFVEWASLTKLAKHLRSVLEEISADEQL